MLLNRPHAIFSVGILMPKLGCRELEILNRAMKSEGLNQQDPPPDNLTNQLSTLKFSFNFLYMDVSPEHMSEHHVYEVPTEAR